MIWICFLKKIREKKKMLLFLSWQGYAFLQFSILNLVTYILDLLNMSYVKYKQNKQV